MRIGLISDTHGYIDAWEKAVEMFKHVDLVIHTGDILSSGPFNPRLPSYKPTELAKAINDAPFPVIFARGNCDAEVDAIALDYPIQSPYALVLVDNLRMMATHGHLHNEDELIELGHRYKLDIMISGHTHMEGIKKRDGLYLVNPGSALLPKGTRNVPTIGLIEDNQIRIVSLEDGIEIDKAEIK
ncbi:MAG TPA: phosphodiesterase [Anaerolineae bacterium]|nr:phosphodiesterase [Anaerolineae bacterium]